MRSIRLALDIDYALIGAIGHGSGSKTGHATDKIVGLVGFGHIGIHGDVAAVVAVLHEEGVLVLDIGISIAADLAENAAE